MQLRQCLICKKHSDQIQNYRDDFVVEPKLITAHPAIRNLRFNEPLFICRQCVNQVMQNKRLSIPQSQPRRSPDTTSEEHQLTESNSLLIASESIKLSKVPEPINLPRALEPDNNQSGNVSQDFPKTEQEIEERYAHEPLKKYKLLQLFKKTSPMPAGVRNRKIQEIMMSNEGCNISESVQKQMVRDFVSKELKQNITRKIGAGNKRPREYNSELESGSSFNVTPRETLSQGQAVMPGMHNKERRIHFTESLSSVESTNVSSEVQPKNVSLAQPQKVPTPIRTARKSPPRKAAVAKKTAGSKSRQVPQRQPTPDLSDWQVPSPVARSTRSNSRHSNEGTAHSNMGAPLRPTIPYITPTILGPRVSKDINGA